MTKADEAMLVEVRDNLRVLRNEAVETRRVLKTLVGVLNDMQQTAEGLRQELTHARTARERAERAAVLTDLVNKPATGEKP